MIINVSVNTDGFEENAEEMIVQSAARQLLDGRSNGTSLANDIRSQVHKDALELVRAEITSGVKEMITEALNEEIRQTNNWGEPVGQSMTFRTFISEEFKTRLNERVDSHGDAVKYTNSDTMTRLQWMAKQIAKQYVDSIANDVKEEIKAGVGEQMKEQVLAAINLALFKK